MTDRSVHSPPARLHWPADGFITTDGGKTWKNTKFISENTGFVDLAMNPESPDTLYAAAYQRRRRAFGFNGGGPESGLYKNDRRRGDVDEAHQRPP